MTTRNQPSYDFITGDENAGVSQGSVPLRHKRSSILRQSQSNSAVRSDPVNEELRAQVNTLQYELESLKQERQMEKLQQERELRDAQKQAEEDYTKAQVAESARTTMQNKVDAMAKELSQADDRATNERTELERRIRSEQEACRELREEVEEAKAELASGTRAEGRRVIELEGRVQSLQSSVEELTAEADSSRNALESTQKRLSDREVENGELEAKLLELKAGGGGGSAATEEMALLKRELSGQTSHIRKLEMAGREHKAEIERLTKLKRSVDVVEEEKLALQAKLRAKDELQYELDQTRARLQDLENERLAWTEYLESDEAASVLRDGAGGSADQEQLSGPADLARALVSERLTTAALQKEIGELRPEVGVRNENISALEEDKKRLQAELEQAKSQPQSSVSGGGGADSLDAKTRARLERQRALALKESEYLRAQLQTFEAEDGEGDAAEADAQRAARIADLESLLESHKSEISTLNTSLTALEHRLSTLPQNPTATSPASTASAGTKRTHDASSDPEADDRMGELRRRNRSLQDAQTAAEKRTKLLEHDLKAVRAQYDALKKSSRVRVLELKQNPTAEAETIKAVTNRILKEENRALLARLESASASAPTTRSTRSGSATSAAGIEQVPKASLDALNLELEELQRALAQRDKMTARLKTIWGAKSLEFREAVASILGWKMDFMPNGRVRVTSMFNAPGASGGRAHKKRGGAEDGGEGEREENSIIFDGEKGTMKVSGGPESAFAGEIRDNIAYWVEGRKEIPCFLAALTLEFWEKRGGTMAVG